MDGEGIHRLGQNRPFLLVLLGQTLAEIGDRSSALIFTWWVVERSGSPAMIGGILAAFLLPQSLLSPLGGVFGDRWNRGTVLALSNAARAGLVLLAALLQAQDSLSLAALLPIAMGIGMAAAVFNPTLIATIPSVVPEGVLLKASSLNDAVGSAAGILGPMLGGVLVTHAGGTKALGAAAFLLALGSLCIWGARLPAPAARPALGGVLRELADGFLYVGRDKLVLGLALAFGALNFFGAPLFVYLPILARRTFHGTAQTLGGMEATLGIGATAAGIWLLVRPSGPRKGWLVFRALSATGCLFAALALMPSYWPCLAALLGIGFAFGVASIGSQVIFQTIVPNERLARVIGIIALAVNFTQVIAYGVFGQLLTLVSLEQSLLLSGLGVLLSAAWLRCLPDYRGV